MAELHREAAARVRTPSAEPGTRCSCDLLLALSTESRVSELLGAFGVTPGALLEGRRALHEVLAAEPADWRVRLAARGGSSGPLEELLAMVRSADSHAYQLLENLGVSCTKLRRHIIECMRERAESRSPVGAAARDRGRPASPMGRPRRTPSAAKSPSVRASPRTAPIERAQVDAPSPRRASAREDGPPRPAIQPEAATRASSRDVASSDAVGTAHAIPRASNERIEEPRSELRPTRGVRDPINPELLPSLCGRDRDLARLADALGRRTFRAPLLVGAPGSGRTLLACHLARIIDRPMFLLSATEYDDEDGLRRDLQEVSSSKGIAILDDLDRVPSEAAPPFLGALSHAWSTGSPPVLTVVSPEGHGRLGTWLPGAVETMDVLTLDPLRGADLEAAVRSSAPDILSQHGVELASNAKLGELTRLADRYLTGLAMPARALDLLDLACARTVRGGSPLLDRQAWLDIVSERSGLPPSRIEVRGDQDMLDLEARLSERIVGHAEVTSTLARLIRRNRAGFGSNRPVLSALLLGPSGVGKTEIAKALCAALFDREDALVRLDMSEFSESHAVARIVGAPPGYVGHEQGGALTDPLLTRPHCVVLLDEIEKAHRDVHQLLLQVFDEGRLTDGRGRTIDFRHAVVVMTSNLGANVVIEAASQPHPSGSVREGVLEKARNAFPVELWNRIEAPLVLEPLTGNQMAKICRRLARTSSDRLFRERGVRYGLSDQACEHLVALAGRDPALGARPLRHLLTREVESPIADAILRGQVRAGMEVEAHASGGRILLRMVTRDARAGSDPGRARRG